MCGEFDDNSPLRACRSYISTLHYTNSISEPGKIDKSCSRVFDTVSVSPSTTLFGSSTHCDYISPIFSAESEQLLHREICEWSAVSQLLCKLHRMC